MLLASTAGSLQPHLENVIEVICRLARHRAWDGVPSFELAARLCDCPGVAEEAPQMHYVFMAVAKKHKTERKTRRKRKINKAETCKGAS